MEKFHSLGFLPVIFETSAGQLENTQSIFFIFALAGREASERDYEFPISLSFQPRKRRKSKWGQSDPPYTYEKGTL